MANDMGVNRTVTEIKEPSEAPAPFHWIRLTHPTVKALAWAFVISRLFFVELAGLAYVYLPHAWVEAPQGTLPPGGSLWYRALLGLWVHWDGLWYLSISTFGYQGRPTATAFFPLYPLTMHLLGGGVVVGVFISLAAFAGAVGFFYRLVALDFGPRVAWYTVLAMVFFPTAFYANAVYSESLFLLFATASLYFGRTRRYWLAGPLAALATLDTMYGVLLALPLAWLIWHQERHRLWPLAHVFWIPAGLGAYMAYLVPLFGDPLVFERAQSNWGRHFAPFYETLWQAGKAAWTQISVAFNPHALFVTGQPSIQASNFYNFVFALAAIAVVVAVARRLPFYLLSYTLLALLVPLSYPAQGNPLMSMPRLVLEAFPVFTGLGLLMSRSPSLRVIYFVVALPLGALFVALFATAHWVA